MVADSSRRRSILAEVAVTAPSKLGPRRKQLLSPARLAGIKTAYDVVVIGSGLAALTAANRLAKAGHSVLLLEQHYNFGGMATWFKRPKGHIFDISLHGFPAGMIKTCRKYWNQEIADSIVRLRSIRFDNPQFSFETQFDRADFSQILVEYFRVPKNTVDDFFSTLAKMNFYDDQTLTTRALFEQFFPGRSDVARFLLEPIAYANGSTLDDPAISYGIVFSNFMASGVYTFSGGTDQLIRAMKHELVKNGVELRNYVEVERIVVDAQQQVREVVANGVAIRTRSVLSNANLRNTIFQMVGETNFSSDFIAEARKVRMNSASSQVYFGIRQGDSIPFTGDLLFTSSLPEFDSAALCALSCTSRTFSFYYPDTRPGPPRYAIVASINSNYRDWVEMSPADYVQQKEVLAEETLRVLAKYVPDIRDKIDHVEVATPRTFEFFTRHAQATSFGTKFEGLKISRTLPEQVHGLFHAGSVGIIMSGWLGAANYGVIVANEVDRFLLAKS